MANSWLVVQLLKVKSVRHNRIFCEVVIKLNQEVAAVLIVGLIFFSECLSLIIIIMHDS